MNCILINTNHKKMTHVITYRRKWLGNSEMVSKDKNEDLKLFISEYKYQTLHPDDSGSCPHELARKLKVDSQRYEPRLRILKTA